MISAIYFGQRLDDAREARSTDLSVGLATWRDPPGRRVTTARRLLSSTPECIALMADSDSRPRYEEQVSVLKDIGVVLQRNLTPTPEQARINPSLWMQTIGGPVVPGKDLGEVCR